MRPKRWLPEGWSFHLKWDPDLGHGHSFLGHQPAGVILSLRISQAHKLSDDNGRDRVLEGQEGPSSPARRRGHLVSPVFIDTAMTVPGTAVNQRNCREKHSEARHTLSNPCCNPTRAPVPCTRAGTWKLWGVGQSSPCAGEHRTLPASCHSVWSFIS